MTTPTRHLKLSLVDCDRVTDWLQWVYPASPAERRLNRRLCEQVEAARRRERRRVPAAVDLDMPVGVLSLPGRIQRALEGLGVETLGELLRQTEGDLLGQPRISRLTLRAIERELERYGLHLGMLPRDSTARLSVEDARRALLWYRQTNPILRSGRDRRIGRAIADFLGASLEDDVEIVSEMPGEIGPPPPGLPGEVAPDPMPDAAGGPAPAPPAPEGFALEEADLADDPDDDMLREAEAFEAGADPDDGDDDLPPEEAWRNSLDWRPDDPDAWKGAGGEDDADYWKRGAGESVDETDDLDDAD